MFHKSLTLSAAALAGLLCTGAAQAATIGPLPASGPALQTAGSPTLDLAAWRRWHNGGYWHRGHGYWHDGWHGHGYWGPGVALGLGLGLAAPYAYGYDDDYDYGYGGYAYARGSHVQWCLDHYRTYNPRSNTFIGNDGYRHACVGRYY